MNTPAPRHGRQAPRRGPALAPAEERRLPRDHAHRWAPGHLPLRVQLAPAGVVVGVEPDGMSVTFPLLVPTHSTRVGIVAERALAQLLALRLLNQSCDLTVVTDRHDEWQRLAAGVPHLPFAISHQLRRWPLEGTPAPWALIIDMDDPPPTSFVRTPWSTVIHLAPSTPQGSGWWQSAHVVLTTRAHAREVATLRPRLDVAVADRLGGEDVVAIDHGSVTVFRPALDQHEYALLTSLEAG